MFQDNLGTIRWTEDVQGLRKVKHIGMRYHYVRDAVDTRNVAVQYTESEHNRADMLTKILTGDPFVQHCTWLGCYDIIQLSTHRGGVSKQ